MRKFGQSFFIYFIGIIILAFGITLMILSQLGASPYDALLVGLYRTFGLSIGTWEMITGAVIVLLNAIATKSKPEYLAMLTSFITGIGIDSWLFLLDDWLTPDHVLNQALCILFGILFTGIGIGIYLESSFAPNPMDRSMVIVTDKTGWSFSTSRAVISIVLLVIAFFFDGAIGIGTLLNAILTGFVIQWVRPYILVILSKRSLHEEKISQ